VQRVNGGVKGREGAISSGGSRSGGSAGSRGHSVLRVFSNSVHRLLGRHNGTIGRAKGTASGGGRILFVNSLTSSCPVPGDSVYAASKAFVASFAQVPTAVTLVA